MSDLEDWIQKGHGGGVTSPRCSTCRLFSHLDPDIMEFLSRKAAGEVFLPVHSHVGSKSLLSYLSTKGYTLSGHTLARHIGLCLGRNPSTGKPV